jgi:ABC-type transporter Mla maintaining outer membrane lipid asymmetry permease subunit MlaE
VREAGETFGKTSVIVTHDYAPFEGKTTRVVFLDPKAKTLREVSAAEIASVMADAQVDALAPPEVMPPGGPLADLGRVTGDGGRAVLSWVRSFFEETPGLIARLWAKLPFAFWPRGARARWFLRQLAHYARICFLGTAIPYMAIAGIIAGFVATYFTYKFLPKKPWSEPLVLDDVLPGLGFALYRVIVPVLGTVLIAGRTGAALASDVGNRAYLHQVAALKTLGARPEPYLATASLWANVVGTLFLSFIAFWAASWTSLCVFAWTQPGLTPYYWSTHFFTKLAPFHLGIVAKGALWVLAKLVICGSGTALIAYEIGTREKKSAAEVSHGITATVYWATLFVLFVHLGFAFWEFDALDDAVGR